MHVNATKKQQSLATDGLLLTTFIWGWGFIFSKMALDAGISPLAMQAARFVLASLCAVLFFGKRIGQSYQKGQWKSCFFIGSILFVAFMVQAYGLVGTTPGNSAFITTTYVVMVPFLSWRVTQKRPAGVMFLACLVALGGLAVLTVDVRQGVGFGDLLTLVGAFLFAAQIVATDRVLATIDPSVLVSGQMLVAALWSLLAFFVTGPDFTGLATGQGAVSVVFLGVFSSFVCYLLQTVSQKYLSSIRAGILLAGEALFACLFSVLLGYDRLTPRILVGGLLLVAASTLPQLWQQRKNQDAE